MIFILSYIVSFPVVLIIAKIYMEQSGASSSIGDYLVLPCWWAFLWTFVPAILLSMGIDVYKKGKKEAENLGEIDNPQEQVSDQSNIESDEKEKP